MRCENCRDYMCMERRTAGECLHEKPEYQIRTTDGTGQEQPCAGDLHTIAHEWRSYRNEVAKEVFQRLIGIDDTDYDVKCKAKRAVNAADELVFALIDDSKV